MSTRMFILPLILGTIVAMSTASLDINYSITEERGVNMHIGSVADDAHLNIAVDSVEEFLALRYSLLKNGNPVAEKFAINETTGHLYTAESLDRDTICAYQPSDCHLSFEVIAQSSMGSFFQIKVDILLIDINDNAPTFDNDYVDLSISEATKINSSISLNGAQDPDFGSNSIHSYKIESIDSPFEAESDTFTDGRSMLKLTVKKALDRERQSSYLLQVSAYDGGDPPNIGSLLVNVSITDVNEFAPAFTKPTFNDTIYEDHKVDIPFMTVSAHDPDGGTNGEIKYSLSPLQASEILSTFKINEATGEISLQRSLINDSKDVYKLIVVASDKAKQPMLSQVHVFIKVIDNHNNVPKINIDLLSNTQYAEISEHASQGAAVAHVAVTDKDTGANGLVTCNVLSENFRIQKYDDMEYKIVVYSSLNRELHETYVVTVMCQDNAANPETAYSTFTVLVLDENDNAPRFLQHNYYAHVDENNAIGVSALTVSATDIDKGRNSVIRYSLSQNNNQNFNVNPETGAVYVNFVLDRELMNKYSFQVLAKDMGNPTQTGTAVVNIIVEDLNDNVPIFGQEQFHYYVQENLPPNQTVGHLQAIDLDLYDNGVLSYSLSPLPNQDFSSVPFWLMQNGSIMTSVTFDREKIDRFDFIMIARDRGNPSLEGKAVITVHVIDDNDNSPLIIFPSLKNNTATISYQTPFNKVITTIHASDNDTGMNSKLTYYTEDKNISEMFLVNSFSGDIYLIKELQSTDIGSYSFEVTVQDGGTSFPRHTSQTMVIKVTEREPTEAVPHYAVIAICISVVTIFIAAILILAIYLLRRYDQRKQDRFNKHIDESFSDKTTQDDSEAGFGDSPVDSNSNLSFPPSYNLVVAPPPIPKRPATIDRSISLQVSATTESQSLRHPHIAPVWENGGQEMNDTERQRNKLINLQYQQSLMRIQSCNRSVSVMTI